VTTVLEDPWEYWEPITELEIAQRFAGSTTSVRVARTLERVHGYVVLDVMPRSVLDELVIVTEPLRAWLDRENPYLRPKGCA